MARKLHLLSAFAAILLISFASRGVAAAPAAPPPTNLALPYPAKSPLVVHLNGVERSKERLAKMLESLPPAEAKQIQKGLTEGMTHLLKDRKLDALPKDGRVFLVVHDFAKLFQGDVAVSVLLPVTSYKEFKDTLLTGAEKKSIEKAGDGIESIKTSATGDEETLYLVELKNYVAVTPSKDTAEIYTAKFTPAQSAAMGTDLSASYLAADVSIFVNMDAINDLYGDQIRQFKGLIDFALGQAQNMGMIPGLGKKQIELAKVFLGGMVQAIEDSKGIVIAAEFRPEGLNLRGQIRFADETQSSDMLKGELPTQLAGLAKMPRGMNTYGATKLGKKFTDLGKKFTQEFLAGDDDEKGAERLEKLLSELAQAGVQGEITAGSPPDRTISVTPYRDATKAAEASVKLFEGLGAGGKFATIVLKEKPKITYKAATHRDFTFAEVGLSLDFAATVEGLPEAARDTALAQFKRLMKEKTSMWIGTDGKVLVQLAAKDWTTAKTLLDEYLDGKSLVGSDEGFKLARENLPQDASMLYLLETGQMISMMVEQVKGVAGSIPGVNVPPIGSVKPVKGDPTYVGIAVTLKPQVASFDLFVPGTSMNVATKMIAPLFRNLE